MGIYIKGWDVYPAIVRRRGAIFEAQFVDFPGCVVFGPSAVEAEMRAQPALATYADAMIAQAKTMPSPSIVQPASERRDEYIAYVKLPPAMVAAAVRPSPWRGSPTGFLVRS